LKERRLLCRERRKCNKELGDVSLGIRIGCLISFCNTVVLNFAVSQNYYKEELWKEKAQDTLGGWGKTSVGKDISARS